MFINLRRRELNLKVVYYGPALSGKTTNLQYIYAHVNPSVRGDLVSLKTSEDRTIFFDYLLLEFGQIAGLKPKFSLYTVPGQVHYATTRKLVLQGADGVVFVVDSRLSRLQDNLHSFHAMYQQLGELGIDPHQIPIVIQFNKRDLADAAPVPLLYDHFVSNGTPAFEAVATQGLGVFDTLKMALNLVVDQVRQKL